MALLQVKAFIKETNLGLLYANIESTSTEYIQVEMCIRSEDIERLYPLDEKIVLKLYNGEYLIVSGELDELQFEIDSLEYPESYEAEIDLEENT